MNVCVFILIIHLFCSVKDFGLLPPHGKCFISEVCFGLVPGAEPHSAWQRRPNRWVSKRTRTHAWERRAGETWACDWLHDFIVPSSCHDEEHPITSLWHTMPKQAALSHSESQEPQCSSARSEQTPWPLANLLSDDVRGWIPTLTSAVRSVRPVKKVWGSGGVGGELCWHHMSNRKMGRKWHHGNHCPL